MEETKTKDNAFTATYKEVIKEREDTTVLKEGTLKASSAVHLQSPGEG